MTKKIKLNSKLINTDENLLNNSKIEKTKMISKGMNTDEMKEDNERNQKKFDEKFVFTKNEMAAKSTNTDSKEESSKYTQYEEEMKTPKKQRMEKIKLISASQQTDPIKLKSIMINTMENEDFSEKCHVCEQRKGIKSYNEYQQTEKALITDKKVNTDTDARILKIEKFFIFQKKSRTLKESEKCEECEERKRVKKGVAYQQTEEIKKIDKRMNTMSKGLCLRIATFRIFNNFASIRVKTFQEQFANTKEVIFKNCLVNTDEIEIFANEKSFAEKIMNTKPIELKEKSLANEKWLKILKENPSIKEINDKKDIYTSIEFKTKNEMFTSTKDLNEKDDMWTSINGLIQKKDFCASTTNKNDVFTSMTELKSLNNRNDGETSLSENPNQVFKSKLIAKNDCYTSTSEFNKINGVCTSTSDLQSKNEKEKSHINKKEIFTSTVDLNKASRSKNEIYTSIENFRTNNYKMNKNGICTSTTQLNNYQETNGIKNKKEIYTSTSEFNNKLETKKSVCTSLPELTEIYPQKNAEISTSTTELINHINPSTPKKYAHINKDEAQTSTSDLLFPFKLNNKKEISTSTQELQPNISEAKNIAVISKDEAQTSTSDLLFEMVLKNKNEICTSTTEIEPNISNQKKLLIKKDEAHTSTSDLLFPFELNNKKEISNSNSEIRANIPVPTNLALAKKHEVQTSTSDLLLAIEFKNKKEICTSTTELQSTQDKSTLTNFANGKPKKGSVDAINGFKRDNKRLSLFNNMAGGATLSISPFKKLCEEWLRKDSDSAKKRILTQNVITLF